MSTLPSSLSRYGQKIGTSGIRHALRRLGTHGYFEVQIRDVQNWPQLAAAAIISQRWLSQLVVFEYPLSTRVASPLILNRSKQRDCHSVPCQLIISSAVELAGSNIELALRAQFLSFMRRLRAVLIRVSLLVWM